MTIPVNPQALSLFAHPYRELVPVTGGKRQLRAEGRIPGSALVWRLPSRAHEHDAAVVNGRPGGLSLIVILPEVTTVVSDPQLVSAINDARPAIVLPHHPVPSVEDLTTLLRTPPEDLGVEITDYLHWRGIRLEREATHLVRRIVALSAELRSVSALCRSLYLSRRALGRRFLGRGLPVPSHWLHMARILRVAIRLQNSEDSVLSVGFELGYPDAFALSNQMMRLTGYRPTDARMFLGWEWLLEAWLRREADAGSLTPGFTDELLASPGPMQPRRIRSAPDARMVAEPSVSPRRRGGGRAAG